MVRVTFRVPESLKYELESRAGSTPISQYMIAMMERDWHRSDQYEAIVAGLDELRSRYGGGEDGSSPPLGLLVELLLLTRTMAGPDAQRRVKAEVKRLGLDVWSANNLD